MGEWVSVVDVLLGYVDVKAMLTYFCPRALPGKADRAPVFNLPPVSRLLDDVVDCGPGKTPIAEVEYRDLIGQAESALYGADPA